MRAIVSASHIEGTLTLTPIKELRMSDTDTKTTEDKPVETAEERKERLEAEKEAAAEAKERAAAAEEKAKQDAIDIETFWSYHRGDLLVRDSRGCLDLNVAHAEYLAKKAEAEDEKADSKS
jgi:hypothetical protein